VARDLIFVGGVLEALVVATSVDPIVCDALADAGCRTITYGNLDEVGALRTPALVLLDVDGGDTLAIRRAVRAFRDVPVVVMCPLAARPPWSRSRCARSS
jgi:hypothetical protein